MALVSSVRGQQIQVHRPVGLLRAEKIISYVLRAGVLICAIILAVGLGIQFFSAPPEEITGKEMVFQQLLSGKMISSYVVTASVESFVKGIRELNSDVLISLGILLLIALPVIRVAMTVVIFILERDVIYFGITS